ncbi:MAG: hypothetical protein P1V51_15965 [Deltaproteobacteria bacterium]|nr:hypothetical protein [Deltaproteobacteria bacterium]
MAYCSRSPRRPPGIPSGCLLLLFALWPGLSRAEAPADEPSPAAAEETALASPGLVYWLTARQGYRLRDARPGDEAAADPLAPVAPATDQDLHLALDAGLLNGAGTLGADLALGAWLDADGIAGDPAPLAFASVRDGAAGRAASLYLASVFYRPGGWLKEVRLGRMSTGFGTRTVFDGASLSLLPLRGLRSPALARLELVALGGRTAHLYELDGEHFEDWLGAVALRLRPLRDLKLALDYRLMIEDSASAGLDHGYGLEAQWRISDFLGARLEVRGVDDALSRLALAGRYWHEALGFGLDARIDLQLSTLEALNERDDPLFAILGPSHPNLRWDLDLFEEFETGHADYVLHLGWQGREPLDGISAPFNRRQGRLHLTGDALELVIPGLQASLSLEYHHDGGDLGEGLLTLGGAAGYRSEALRGLGGELGSYYQRFKYDYYADVEERQDVRTFFVAAFVDALPWLEVRLRYTLEHFDRTAHSFHFLLTQRLEGGR